MECVWLLSIEFKALTVGDLRGHEGRTPWGSKFFQFHAVFGKIWHNCMLAPPLQERRGMPTPKVGVLTNFVATNCMKTRDHIWSQKGGVSGQKISAVSFHNVSICQMTTKAINEYRYNSVPILCLDQVQLLQHTSMSYKFEVLVEVTNLLYSFKMEKPERIIVFTIVYAVTRT